MMTSAETRQRIAMNDMCCGKRDGEWRISFPELQRNPARAEATAYYTDDNEDAALTAAAMRRQCPNRSAT